jgi:hypothetical protein
MGDATFELPTFSRRTSLHLAKNDHDWAWGMPRSNCTHFPTAQPAPGQVRPGFGVGDATFELPTFSRQPSLNLAKYDHDWAWECHVRIAHISRLPSLHLAEYDQDLAWDMPFELPKTPWQNAPASLG